MPLFRSNFTGFPQCDSKEIGARPDSGIPRADVLHLAMEQSTLKSDTFARNSSV